MQVQLFAVTGRRWRISPSQIAGQLTTNPYLSTIPLTSIVNQTLPFQIPQIQPIVPRRMILARFPNPTRLLTICLEFLKKADRPQRNSTQQAKERRPELPQPDKNPASRSEKPDPLVDLVQIVLTRNIIPVVVLIMLELKDSNKFYRRTVEGNDPDAKDLGE
jgi:hypothetical protein